MLVSKSHMCDTKKRLVKPTLKWYTDLATQIWIFLLTDCPSSGKPQQQKNNVKPWCLEEFKLSFLKELAVNGCLIRNFERWSFNPTLFFGTGENYMFSFNLGIPEVFFVTWGGEFSNQLTRFVFFHLEVEKIRRPIFVPLCSTENGPP